MPRGWARWAVLPLAPVLLYLAFPPFDVSLLVFVGLVPLFWAAFPATVPPDVAPAVSGPPQVSTRRRRPFGEQFTRGYLAGILFYVLHLHWLLKLSKDEITIPWIMIPALLVLGGFLGLFWGFAVGTAGWLQRRFRIHPMWGLPICWTLFDWFRTVGETGFAWGSLGYALAPVPAALQITSWTGFWALPAWIAVTAGLLWRAIFDRTAGMPRRIRFAVAAVIVFAAPIGFGLVVLHDAPSGVHIVSPEPDATGADRTATAAIGTPSAGPEDPASPLRFCLLQANTPREIKWEEDYRELVVADLLARTETAVARYHPDLVVWPETAAPLRILWEKHLAALTSSTIDSLDTWTLVGTLDAKRIEDGHSDPPQYEHYNAAVLFDPEGRPVWRYAKRRMVPFGELTPYKRLLPFLSEIDFGQSDFTMGTAPGDFEIYGDRELSCLICFESTFPELARGDVANGARYLVNITNDFWYGRSAGPVQHQHFAIHRAVENGTPLLRCANSGVSCVIDAHGRVYAATDLFVEEYVTADVLPGHGGTFYTRAGDWPLPLLAVVLLVGIVRGLRDRRRSPLAPPSPETER
ncbi:MAG: apolipoprotein N-acyltransferase [Candidatus Eisenbacteria bacterium]|uniref:Apolipoprotein N-acyltransferase n=1 Tax=Eiseniibacteriota bacterium TaxID=2212470 RepID=A0A956RNT4_UNCEI|nr:apolipoprotein N-acyltransferase [Candidatus Eisenbacteria bacterium]